MRTTIAVMAVLLFAAFAVSAEGAKEPGGTPKAGQPPQKTTLRIYAQYSADDEKQPYDYAVAAMKEIMPQVDLELDVMAQDDNRKIKVYAAAGNLPDIFASNPDIISVFRKSNNLLVLDKYVAELGMAEKLSPAGRALLFSEDGHAYTMPNVGPWAATVFCNKAVFKANRVELPTNYPTMLEAVKAFKKAGVIPLALFKEKWISLQLFDMLATRGNPGGIVALEQGKAQIGDEAYVKAAGRMIELVKAGLVSDDVFNTPSSQAGSLFKEGKAAMYLSGGWACSDLGKTLGEDVALVWAPFADAGKEGAVRWAMSGGGFNQGFSVAANTRHPDLAGKFAVQFGYQFQRGRIIKRGDPNPIIKEPPVPEAGYNPAQKAYAAASQEFQTMTTFSWGLINPKAKTILEDSVQQLLTGAYPVERFTADVQRGMR